MARYVNAEPPEKIDRRPHLHWRIIAMLIGFTLLISVSVIVTDLISIRNRNPAATAPATTQSSSVPE